MSGPPRPSDQARLVRVGAFAGLAGLALAGAAAGRIGTVDQRVIGALVSRLDFAGPLLIAWASFLGARTYAAAASRGTTPAAWPGRMARFLGVVYPVWWASLIGAYAVSSPRGTVRQFVTSAVFFRPTGSPPLANATIGWVVGAGVVGVIGAPVWAWVAKGIPRRDRHLLDPYALVAGLMIVVGIVVRSGVALDGRTTPFGALSWFPARLDLIGLGYLVAVVEARGVPRVHLRRIGLAVAGTAGLVAAFGAGLPRGGRPLDAVSDITVAGLLSLVFSAGVLIWFAAGPPRTDGDGRWRRPSWVLAVCAPGLVLWHEPALDLVARQYRERVLLVDGGRFLTGTVLPLWCWSVVLAAAVGILLTTLIVNPARRVATGRWLPRPFALGFATMLGGAFVVRVVTMLVVAPERTDQGDPLYYHATANLLARGRGLPEPYKWIAYGKVVPAALHGPLYPLVLSISSRIGGTAWVDHKFVSLLIGTAVVGMVGVLGLRLAGRAAALIAMALAAVYPNLWLIDSTMYPEGLLALCSLGCVLLAYVWRDRPRIGTAAAMGATVGLAALARGEGILLLFLLVVPWILRRPDLGRRIRWQHLGAAVLTCAVMVAPWTIYNSTRFAAFVPLSTNGNELVVYSYCDDTFSGPLLGFWWYPCQERVREERVAQGLPSEPPGDESEKALFWRRQGLEYARDHVAELPKVFAARIARQWELFRPWQNTTLAPIEGRDKQSAQIGLLMYYGMAIAAIPGVVILRRRLVPLLPLGAQVVSVTLTAAFAYATTRFRAPVEPVLCLLAGVGLTPVWLALVRRLRAPEDVPLGDGRAFVLGGRPTWSWRGAVAIGAVLAAVALPLRGLYRANGASMEEGFMLVFPQRVLKGDVPNVDFLHLYGPGSLDALAGWYGLFGTTLEAERTFGLIQHLGIIFGIYALTRAWGRVAAVGCALLAVILVLAPIGLQAMAWNGGVALGLWSVVAGVRARAPDVSHRTAWWVTSGVLAGLALTFRPDLVLALVAVNAWFLWRGPRRTWWPIALGVVGGLLPMWVHLARAGLQPSLQGMVLDPVFELRAGRELPRPPTLERFDGALQIIAEKFPSWWQVPHLPGSVQLFLWFFLVLAVGIALPVTAFIVHRRAGAPERTGVLVAASIFSAGLLPQALQRPDSAHFAWVTCVSLPLVPVATLEVIRLVRPHWNRVARMSVALGLVATSYLVVFPFFSYRAYLANVRVSIGQVASGFEVVRDGRRFYVGDERLRDASNEVIADLDRLSRPGERLFVGPADLRQTPYSDVFFYYLFPELKPATYFIEMDPGLANAEGSRLPGDVKSADWLLLTRFWSGWIEPNGSIWFGPDTPNAAVEDNFCLVGSYQHDVVRLYRRTDPADPDCSLPSPGPYEAPYEPESDYAVEVKVPVPPRATDGTFPPGSPAAGDPPR